MEVEEEREGAGRGGKGEGSHEARRLITSAHATHLGIVLRAALERRRRGGGGGGILSLMVLAELLAINNSASSLMWCMKDQWLAGCLAAQPHNTHTHTHRVFVWGPHVSLASYKKKKGPVVFIRFPHPDKLSILHLQPATQAALLNMQRITLSN